MIITSTRLEFTDGAVLAWVERPSTIQNENKMYFVHFSLGMVAIVTGWLEIITKKKDGKITNR